MKKSMTEIVFMMLILILFLFCSFFTILKSADFYQSMQQSQQDQDQVTLPYFYLLNKLNQKDQSITTTIQQVDGIDCLVLKEKLASGTFNTVIFYQEGKIYELLTKENEEIDLTNAEPMISSYGLAMESDYSTITLSLLKQDGRAVRLVARQEER